MVEKMIKVGVCGLRSPEGDVISNVPLYIREVDAGIVNPETGKTVQEEVNIRDISKFLASKFDEYVTKTGLDKL